MFCPLCKAEYRDGFSECHDCHVALAPTFAEASQLRVELWKGNRQKQLDRILAALDRAQIPFHHKEIVNSGYRASVLGFPIGPRRSTFEYEVWVLKGDRDRAKAAIGKESEDG